MPSFEVLITDEQNTLTTAYRQQVHGLIRNRLMPIQHVVRQIHIWILPVEFDAGRREHFVGIASDLSNGQRIQFTAKRRSLGAAMLASTEIMSQEVFRRAMRQESWPRRLTRASRLAWAALFPPSWD